MNAHDGDNCLFDRYTWPTKIGQVDVAGDGRGDLRRGAHGRGEPAGVDAHCGGHAVHVLVGQAGRRRGVPLGLGAALGAGDGGRAGGIGCRGLHRLVGDRDPAGEDDEGDEQHESGYADHRLYDGGAALAAKLSPAAPWVILSTVTDALWDTAGDHPGMTLRLVPVTVTVAVVAERPPVTCAPVSYTH